MLETKCERCDGKGTMKGTYFSPCYLCGGKGFILTKEGKMLLDFVKKHLSIRDLVDRIEDLESLTSKLDS